MTQIMIGRRVKIDFSLKKCERQSDLRSADQTKRCNVVHTVVKLWGTEASQGCFWPLWNIVSYQEVSKMGKILNFEKLISEKNSSPLFGVENSNK